MKNEEKQTTPTEALERIDQQWEEYENGWASIPTSPQDVLVENLETKAHNLAIKVLKSKKYGIKQPNIGRMLKKLSLNLKPDPEMSVFEFINTNVKIHGASNTATALRFDGPFTPWQGITDYFQSRKFQTVCIVGSSRIGKTEISIVAGLAYCIYKGYDAILYHMNEEKAKEFGTKSFQNMLRHSPKIKNRVKPVEKTNSTRLTTVKESIVLFRWPTRNHLASTTARFVFLTDYDRWPLNIDGEGNGYSLARTRTTTYGPDGKTIIESSPGKPITDTEKQLIDPHALPDSPGIVEVYNLGTMFRFYVQCLTCKNFFHPQWHNVVVDETLQEQGADIKTIAESARLECPHCRRLYDDRELKHELTPTGKWVGARQKIDQNGIITGELPDTSIASFHLAAPLTCMKSLQSCKEDELNALKSLEEGKPELYQTFVNTVLGYPYAPISERQNTKNIQLKKDESAQNLEKEVAPSNTLAIVACVDVQSGQRGAFVVQVFAYTQARSIHVIDRFEITKKEDGSNIHPSKNDYSDWGVLIPQVFEYKAKVDGSDLYLKPCAIICDSGGADNSTRNAYEFANSVRNSGYKFILAKGLGNLKVNVDYGAEKDALASRYGLKLLRINTDYYKDVFYYMLDRSATSADSLHFNRELPDYLYEELQAEERTPSGKYQLKEGRKRNEALDLFVYFLAFVDKEALAYKAMRQEYNSWFKPPELGNSNAYKIEGDKQLNPPRQRQGLNRKKNKPKSTVVKSRAVSSWT